MSNAPATPATAGRPPRAPGDPSHGTALAVPAALSAAADTAAPAPAKKPAAPVEE